MFLNIVLFFKTLIVYKLGCFVILCFKFAQNVILFSLFEHTKYILIRWSEKHVDSDKNECSSCVVFEDIQHLKNMSPPAFNMQIMDTQHFEDVTSSL